MTTAEVPATHTPIEVSGSRRSPWLFVPTLYFMQGLPYMIATYMSGVMYKKLGISNEMIALWTSMLIWAWTAKPLWGPIVDSNFTKRGWVVATQGLLILGFAAVAAAIHLPNFFPVTIALFFVVAFLSATHDIACDGYYLLALNKQQQAFFVGIRSTAFRGAMIFVQGGLIWVAGYYEELKFGQGIVWTRTMIGAVIVYGLLWLYGLVALPKPTEDVSGGVRKEGEGIPFAKALVTFFQQPRIGAILAFILLYRCGEPMVFTMAKLFLIDERSAGGVALPTKTFAFMNGTIGVAALIVGGIAGGMMISKLGLKRCLWPMVACMHLPILLYVWAAFARPGLTALYAVVAVDNLGYGFGLAAYLVYLMVVSQRGIYKTSHYAVATGIMALGAMSAGAASGYIQKAVGYNGFFVCAFMLTIPGTLTLLFIPLDKDNAQVMGTSKRRER